MTRRSIAIATAAGCAAILAGVAYAPQSLSEPVAPSGSYATQPVNTTYSSVGSSQPLPYVQAPVAAPARARVKRARTQAVTALARGITQATDRTLNVALGIPTAAEARALIDNLRAPLWS